MNKKRKINDKFAFFLRDDRTTEEKVFDLVRRAHVDDVKDFLLADFLFEANDDTLFSKVESFLSEIYEGRYLVRCSVLENPPEIIEQGKLQIRFVGIDEDFIITVKPEQRQLDFDISSFLKDHTK
jgi:hypothetical protein